MEILRESMSKKCPVSTYEQVCEVVKNELGESPDKVRCICLIYINIMETNGTLLHKLAIFLHLTGLVTGLQYTSKY